MAAHVGIRGSAVVLLVGVLLLALAGPVSAASGTTDAPDGVQPAPADDAVPLTFGCPGFPPQGPRNLAGGVCLHPSDGLSWHETHIRGNAATFYTSHNGIAESQINSTSCGINWYRNDYYQWTWVWYSGSGTRVVPSNLRNALDRGTWAC
jgi:hypothetical protein